MFGLGPFEIIVIGAIAVMLYGKRLPEVGQSVGRVVGDLRRQWQSLSRELELAARVDGPVASRPAIGRGRREDEVPGVRLVDSPRFDQPPGE